MAARRPRPEAARALLERGAEAVAVAAFASMFVVFLLQVFMRYVMRQPLGWTIEYCMIAYLLFVFWGCAFLVRDSEHVAFTMLSEAVAPTARRILALVGALALAAAFIAALPANHDYIAFMQRYRTPVMRVRFDLVFAVFLLFMAAVAWRQLVRLWRLVRPGWQRWL